MRKDRGSGALGGEKRGGGGHMHSCAGFEAETTLCRKVNTGDGRREVEWKGGD